MTENIIILIWFYRGTIKFSGVIMKGVFERGFKSYCEKQFCLNRESLSDSIDLLYKHPTPLLRQFSASGIRDIIRMLSFQRNNKEKIKTIYTNREYCVLLNDTDSHSIGFYKKRR